MSSIQKWAGLVVLVLSCTTVDAVPPATAPSHYPDARTLNLQRKVDGLFERGDFERAYFIYRNELAPAGDKYAQYMIGYMHLMGKGTTEDPVAAFAWYRLAAERGTVEFAAVRDQLSQDLDAGERQRADAIYRQLRMQYSDLVVLLAAIRRDFHELQVQTGSRLAARTNPMTVVDGAQPVSVRSGSDYYGRIRKQLATNLSTLALLGDFADMSTDPDRVDVDRLERLVMQKLESTGD